MGKCGSVTPENIAYLVILLSLPLWTIYLTCSILNKIFFNFDSFLLYISHWKKGGIHAQNSN